MTIYARFAAHLAEALGVPPGPGAKAPPIDPPRDPAHGDLTIHAAQADGADPRALAALLRALPEVAAAEVAGAGFVNLRLTDDAWRAELRAIHAAGDDYGCAGADPSSPRNRVSRGRAGHHTQSPRTAAFAGVSVGECAQALSSWRGVVVAEAIDALRDAAGLEGDPKPAPIGPVRVLRAGRPVAEALAAILAELGPDLLRFALIERKSDAPLDLDLACLLDVSRGNGAFFVPYVHARIGALSRRAGPLGEPDPALLDAADLALVKQAARFPAIVARAAARRAPHRIAAFLKDLTAAAEPLIDPAGGTPDRRALVPDRPELRAARLYLAGAIGQIMRNGLAILGVEAAEEMH